MNREDEHQLIAKYCRALNGEMMSGSTMSNAPRSPIQVLAALDSDHKEEIETMIRYLNHHFDCFKNKIKYRNCDILLIQGAGRRECHPSSRI